MKSFRWRVLPAAAPLLLSACGGLSDAMSAHTDTVARAAGQELKVEQAADILGMNPQVPADPQVVRALADVWVDYTLLATALAEDSTLAALNLDKLVEPAREQVLISKFLGQTLKPDTVFTDQELAQAWITEGPGAEIRARHILLRVPAEASQAQRDSVRALAESLRQRAAGGENFAALATQYSEDPGSAQRGGDLDYFGRGRMVAPFEEAAFKLQPGQISPVVETPFGYHVIRVEDRRQPAIGNQQAEFRNFMIRRSAQQVETTYMDSLSKAAGVKVEQGGLAVIREIAGRPEAQLRGRAAERAIATYRGGEFTSGEFLQFVRTQSPQIQSSIATASDEQLTTAVEQLTRRELLLQEAKRRGVTLTKEEDAEIRAQARGMIDQILQVTGLARLSRGNPATVQARINTLIRDAVAGRAQLIPLDQLGHVLRELYPNEINEGTFARVVENLERIRANQPPPPQLPVMPGMEGQPPQGVPQGAPQGPPQGAPQQPVAPPTQP